MSLCGRERFGHACRREPTDRPPVWLMRQAGRYLPEYRELRAKYDFLTLCQRPDLAREISLQPWRRFGMDAVIVFADILLPAAAMGVPLRVEEGRGPVFEHPVRDAAAIKKLSVPDVRYALRPTLDALEELRFALKDEAALIGFVGSPWTVAAYLVEGGSGDFHTILTLAHEKPELIQELLAKITDVIIPFATAQVHAGADAVQIFDTWGSLLSPERYAELVLPGVQKIITSVKAAGATPILFMRKSEAFLPVARASGAAVVSIGSECNLGKVLQVVGSTMTVQGNLHPEILLCSTRIVREATEKLLAVGGQHHGYIANLGHGVLQQTPVESVAAFVETVQAFQRSSVH